MGTATEPPSSVHVPQTPKSIWHILHVQLRGNYETTILIFQHNAKLDHIKSKVVYCMVSETTGVIPSSTWPDSWLLSVGSKPVLAQAIVWFPPE